MSQRLAKIILFALVAVSAFGFVAKGLFGPEPPVPLHAGSVPPLEESLARAVADVNAEFARSWKQRGVTPAPPADWRTLCRRLSLALVGAGVSLEDLRSLESIPESQRVDVYLERLLQDRRFADYWGERLGRAFVGNEDGPFLVFRRRRFVTWLADQIETNRPYDALLRQLITARGLWTDRPEVNFVTVTSDPDNGNQPDPIKLAARTTRSMLGVRIDCLQCHDDFLGNVTLGDDSDPRSGTQEDFHRLAAFYAPVDVNVRGVYDAETEYKYKYLYQDDEELVEPAVPYAEELLPEDGARRERLAIWATHPQNRPAIRAAVNRIWALMFGKPMTEAVDSIPLHGTLPPGMERLGEAFVEADFDIRALIRTITNTDAFRRDSRAPFEVTLLHEECWAVFPLVPLRPEQVAGCIIQASRVSTIDQDSHILTQLQAYGELGDFVRRYGDTGEDSFQQDNVTVTQRLLVMNGKLIRERAGENPVVNAATHIDLFASDHSTAIQAAYLAVLNRLPEEQESEHFLQRIEQGNRRDVIEDLYWALLNSSELAWNH